MLIYWGGCILSVLILAVGRKCMPAGKEIRENPKRKIILLAFFSALPLIMIAALRYNVGTDYGSYIKEFNNIKGGSRTRLEPLYYLLNKIIALLGLSERWLLIITAFLFCLIVYIAIIENSKDPCLSIFLLLGTTAFFMFMNGMRQMIGCAICLYGLKYVNQKKFIRFLICVLIAGGFHYSCLLFLAVYFLSNIKINTKRSLILIAVVYLLSPIIIDVVMRFLSSLNYYSHYTTYREDGISTWLIVNLAVFVFSAVFCGKKERYTRALYWCQLIIAMLAVFNGRVPLLSRLMWGFALPQILLIPETLSNIKDKKLRVIIKICMIILFFAYSTYSIAVNGTHDVYPYKTFFSL